jgi:hypothetical protein
MARSESEQSRVDFEKRFDGLKLEVNCMNRLLEWESLEHHQQWTGIFAARDSASVPEVGAINPDGAPSVGMFWIPSQSRGMDGSGEFMHAHQGRLPKLNFPMFSGTDPQLWKFRCESYFEMYGVQKSLWIKVASMHLEGAAGRWFQSVEKKVRDTSWTEFCSMLHDWLSRDQDEALIRQLFHICQSGTMSEYMEQFAGLVDQLAAYELGADPIYYAMRLVDGLREDIKSMVMIQRPSSLDAACTLALVQEEDMDSHKKKDTRCYESSSYMVTHRPAYSLPDVQKSDQYEDKKGADTAKGVTVDDKFRALKQYRRARGLCDKCVEKWSYGHKCATSVQLHAIHEL